MCNNHCKLIFLDQVPIWEQLRLEEALFRADEGNYCLINQGSSPAVVLGLSAKVEEVLHQETVDIPVWRRFSGGGTVVIDEQTLFVTFIGNAKDFGVEPYPHDLFGWTAKFYQEALQHPHFALRENDYVMGEKKMGGNAQAFARGRFVHHTSFLWDYHPDKMALLKMPPKMPAYRERREHGHFLTKLREHFPSKEGFVSSVALQWKREFGEEEVGFEECAAVLDKEHRKALVKINL